MPFFEIEDSNNLWNIAIALDWYSNWEKLKFKPIKTPLGQVVHEYKYYRNLTAERREEIVRFCVDSIIRVLRLQEDVEKPTFNCCIAVMSNSESIHSLPKDIALQLSYRFDWLRDESRCLIKTRKIDAMKNISREKRPGHISGVYQVDSSYSMAAPRGFLIIDDVYETGSTLREICTVLQRAYPEIPRYVLSITRRRIPLVWRKFGS